MKASKTIDRFYLKCPIQILKTKLNIPQDYKQKCIEEIYRLGDSMNQTTNVKASMTSYKIWEQSKVFDTLIKQIKLNINEIWPLPDPEFEYKLEDTWASIYKTNDKTISHNHLPTNTSFVYYLKSNRETPIIFDECNFYLNPTDDDLIIFPSHLYHSVPKHNNDEDRICVAGNLNIISK